MPNIHIVDENDISLGDSSIQEARDKGLWHRYIRLLVADGEGSFLLQLRGPQNRIFPECWDYSAAGHVDAGEDYETAAIRETREELGLGGVSIKEIEYFKSEDRHGEQYLNRFNKTFQITVPKDTKLEIDPSEVLGAKWFTTDEVVQLVSDFPDKVTPALVKLSQSI